MRAVAFVAEHFVVKCEPVDFVQVRSGDVE